MNKGNSNSLAIKVSIVSCRRAQADTRFLLKHKRLV